MAIGEEVLAQEGFEETFFAVLREWAGWQPTDLIALRKVDRRSRPLPQVEDLRSK